MSTKKVKNSSQSGTVNKGFGAGTKPKVTVVEKKEVEKVGDLVATIDAKVEIDTAKNIPMDIEPKIDLDDADFGYGKFRNNVDRTMRKRGVGYNDEPIVYIAGEKRTLVKLDVAPKVAVSDHYYREVEHPLEVSGNPAQRFSPNDIATNKPVRWYHVALPEIDVYVTQGSELTVDDHISSHCGWEGEDEEWVTPVKGKRPELFVIGSIMKCRSLSIGSSLAVNNSSLETTGHIDAICSKVMSSRVNTVNSIDLFHSGLYTSHIDGSNHLMLRHSRYLRDLNLSGFDHIKLSKIHTSGQFRINIAWQPISGLGLDIDDIYLVAFSAQFQGFGDVFGKEYGLDKPWKGHGLYIRRRTDYGYFAGAAPVPFVRCGDYNIATSFGLYLAKEIDTVSFPKEKQPLTYQPMFGGGMIRNDYTPMSEDNSYTMGMRGGKLWEKARKDCFGVNHNPDKQHLPIGVIGDNLVQSLVDQIKSRIKLYVEMAVLIEV